jgi:hypothetical protein
MALAFGTGRSKETSRNPYMYRMSPRYGFKMNGGVRRLASLRINDDVELAA